jgi:cation diffusion facilitator family transporter
MKISLAVGIVLLAVKATAFRISGSPAILSDLSESVIHNFAVAFAGMSVWISQRPADRNHQYGHEKIAFFSAGAEGVLIVVAAGFIIFEAIARWRSGLSAEGLGMGTVLVAAAGIANGALGWWLVREGRRHNSIIVEANGRHVLTDCWTSLGVTVGLSLALATGWLPLDPIAALFVAANICWSGWHLVRRSVGGLMDEARPETSTAIVQALDSAAAPAGIGWHGLRHRSTGRRTWVELHLLFPRGTPIETAHAQASAIERAIERAIGTPATVLTHLESREDHKRDHPEPHA